MKTLIGAYYWITGRCLWHSVFTAGEWQERRYRLDTASWELRPLSPAMAEKAAEDWAIK
jgi:hypothetical protein